jgi:hypothetical protein
VEHFSQIIVRGLQLGLELRRDVQRSQQNFVETRNGYPVITKLRKNFYKICQKTPGFLAWG